MKDIFIYALIVVNLFILINIKAINKDNTNYEYVEIKGYVNEPGVYKINDNMIVEDLIKLAGGLKDDADISIINQSRKLSNQDVIIIYSKKEIEAMREGSTSVKYIDKECVCPVIDNSGIFDKVITNADGVIISTGKVSINSASLEELMTLPGIGKSKAELIIKYRDENKGFKEIKEIMNVKGIGTAIYEKLKDYLSL